LSAISCCKKILSSDALAFLSDLANMKKAYLVGGAVRDLFLNRDLHDLDIALTGAVKTAELMHPTTKAVVVTMGEKTGQPCLRFIFRPLNSYPDLKVEEKQRYSVNLNIDLSEMSNSKIEEDLKLRDFTINAMALPLEIFLSYLQGDILFKGLSKAIVDPFRGKTDLKEKSLRAVNGNIFRDDPIRLWRLWRFAANLGFKPVKSTLELVIRDSSLAGSIPGEKLHSELFSILDQTHSAAVLLDAAACGLIDSQFPAMSALRGCTQCDYHHQDVWAHSFQVLYELEKILENLSHLFMVPDQRRIIETWLVSGHNRAVLKLAALFHDIGKPEVKTIDEEGRIRFLNHEEVGLPLLNLIAKDLCLSRQEKNLLLFLVKRHLQIQTIISKANSKTKARFWRDHREDIVGLILLSCADLIAKKGPLTKSDAVKKYIDIEVPSFLEFWLKNVSSTLSNKPLLDGSEIMAEFNISQGKQVGELKKAIWEAQVQGEITCKEEALALVRNIVKGEADSNN